MTKPDLENELSDTLRSLADAYEPAVFDATDEATRRRVRPIIVAAAAVLVLLAGLAVALTTNNDSADDVDVRGEPEPNTTTPPTETVETLTESRPAPNDALDSWTWSIGAPSPLTPRTRPSIVWSGDEVALWGGAAGGTPADDGAAYNPVTNSWRSLTELEITAAEQLRDGLDRFPPPETESALAAIVVGTVWAVIGEDGSTTAWLLVGEDGAEVALPPIPSGVPFHAAAAAWTGSALVVWGGEYNCPAAASCVFGPTTPFVLRPALDGRIDARPATTEELSATWILSGIEIDGERIEDDESATVSLDFSPTTKPHPLPVAVTGWAGCAYAADLLWPGPGADLQWPTAPEPCSRTVSEFAGVFRSRLAETTRASVDDTGPAPVLWLEGPGLRIILVPATSATVPGVLKIIDGDAPGPFELDCLAQMASSYDSGEGAGSPTMLDEARRVLSIGTWYVEGNRMATFDENGVATRILNFSQGANGSWVRGEERTCQPDR